MNYTNLLGMLLVAALISFVLFLILREALCWYWKINEILGQLEAMTSALERIGSKLGNVSSTAAPAVATNPKDSPPASGKNRCAACGATNGSAMSFCQQCGAKLA